MALVKNISSTLCRDAFQLQGHGIFPQAPGPSPGSLRPSPFPLKSQRKLPGVIECLQRHAGYQRKCSRMLVRRQAKFQEFDTDSVDLAKIMQGRNGAAVEGPTVSVNGEIEDVRDDRVLPDSLEEAVVHSSEAASLFINSGGTRAIVELLIPDLENLSETGAQEQLWKCAFIFMQSLQKELGMQQLKAIFPDAGAAAMAKHSWGGATFGFASLDDRSPVGAEDEAVVLLAPDHQLLTKVLSIETALTEADEIPRPLVMWNPRLISGDVGIGYNVRKLRDDFLSSFEVVYSLRPTNEGAIFKRFPRSWQVFRDDPDKPGRYLLVADTFTRPGPDDIDELARELSDEEPTVVSQATSIFSSLQRFMKALSN